LGAQFNLVLAEDYSYMYKLYVIFIAVCVSWHVIHFYWQLRSTVVCLCRYQFQCVFWYHSTGFSGGHDGRTRHCPPKLRWDCTVQWSIQGPPLHGERLVARCLCV